MQTLTSTFKWSTQCLCIRIHQRRFEWMIATINTIGWWERGGILRIRCSFMESCGGRRGIVDSRQFAAGLRRQHCSREALDNYLEYQMNGRNNQHHGVVGRVFSWRAAADNMGLLQLSTKFGGLRRDDNTFRWRTWQYLEYRKFYCMYVSTMVRSRAYPIKALQFGVVWLREEVFSILTRQITVDYPTINSSDS